MTPSTAPNTNRPYLNDIATETLQGLFFLLYHILTRNRTLLPCQEQARANFYPGKFGVGRYLGGETSLSFSEAGSPPTPQWVLGIS